jgi:hypothetical protein
MNVSSVEESKGFSPLKREPRKITWQDPATGTIRELSYTVVSKEEAVKGESNANMVFMAGNKVAEEK